MFSFALLVCLFWDKVSLKRQLPLPFEVAGIKNIHHHTRLLKVLLFYISQCLRILKTFEIVLQTFVFLILRIFYSVLLPILKIFIIYIYLHICANALSVYADVYEHQRRTEMGAESQLRLWTTHCGTEYLVLSLVVLVNGIVSLPGFSDNLAMLCMKVASFCWLILCPPTLLKVFNSSNGFYA